MVGRTHVVRKVAPERRSSEEKPRLKNPFVKLVEYISTPTAFRVPSLETIRKSDVRFALISLPELPLKDETRVALRSYSIVRSALADLDLPSCERQLVELTSKFAAEYAEWYLDALDYALRELNADIVCINELGIPACRRRPLKRVLNRTRELAERHSAFIIAGSAHDARTFYNSGRAFFPGCPPNGEYFHKQVSAIAAHERISLPPERKARCTKIFGLRVAMLICLDLADFASVAAVVRAADLIDVLVVPCYSESMEPLEKIARHASEAMAGVVSLVNYKRAGQLGYVYCKFGETTDLSNGEVLSSGAVVHSFDLPFDDFKARKEELQSSGTGMEWLFGPQTQAVRFV